MGLPVENTFPLTLMFLSCMGNHLEKNFWAFLCPAFSSALKPLGGGGQRNNLTGKFGQKLGIFFLLVVSCPYRIRILSCSFRGRPSFRLCLWGGHVRLNLRSSLLLIWPLSVFYRFYQFSGIHFYRRHKKPQLTVLLNRSLFSSLGMV